MKDLKEEKYTISKILEWQQNKELNFEVNIQKKSRISKVSRSYLINLILNNHSTGTLVIYNYFDVKKNKDIKIIIDGRKRIKTIINFYKNRIQLLELHNKILANMKYRDLPDNLKESFLNYQIPVIVVDEFNYDLTREFFNKLNINYREKIKNIF